MPATYTSLPISVPAVMRAIVSEVETNLVSETSLDIDRVSFKCETWIKLMERLSKESQVPAFDTEKYPLIALIRNFDEKYSDNTDVVDVSLTLVIVTPSTPTKESEDREVDNYTPILYPIYAEFMQVLKDGNYFSGYKYEIPHTKTDNMHLGVDGQNGNSKYLLPDCVDGIIISDLKLSLSKEKCSGFFYGPNVELTYINNIDELTLVAVDGGLTITLVGAHNSTLNVDYYVSVSDGFNDPQLITIGGSHTISTNAVDDGDYYGFVFCDDGFTSSYLYFAYTVTNGAIRHYTSSVKFSLENFTFTGEEYTDYPFDVIHRHVYTRPLITGDVITMDGGNVLYGVDYTPPVSDTTLITTSLAHAIPTTYEEVINTITVNEQQLISQSYYKITII